MDKSKTKILDCPDISMSFSDERMYIFNGYTENKCSRERERIKVNKWKLNQNIKLKMFNATVEYKGS